MGYGEDPAVGGPNRLPMTRSWSRERKTRAQYGGYDDPRLVTKCVRVRIPSKKWLYLLRERSRSFASNGFPSRKESSAPLLVICWDHYR
ncbi:hypothetical protein TNCV_1853631 [Trichonephila clavipes]|nr:hypothetical protein TNCV_1853631 [Trichonephila clavipes]